MRFVLVIAFVLLPTWNPAADTAPHRVLYGVISPGEFDAVPEADALFERLSDELPDVEVERVAYDTDLLDNVPAGVIAIAGITVNGDMHFRITDSPLSDLSAILLEVRFPPAHVQSMYAHETALAGTLYALGRCDEMADALLYPDEFSVKRLTLTGNCALVEGDEAAAADAYTPVVDQLRYEHHDDTRMTPAVVNLAWVRLQQGDPDAALALVDRLVDLYAAEGEPFQHAAMLAQRSRFHALAFNFDAAIADATAAIDLEDFEPSLARYHKLRGDHIFLIYEWDRVLDDYNRAIELAPDYADAYFARGVLFYTQGPRPAALEDFQTFIELAPDNDPRAGTAAEYVASIEAELAALGGDDTGAFGPSD